MANTFNERFWILDTDDILKTSAVCVRRIFLQNNADGDGVSFFQLPKGVNATADNDDRLTNITFSGNNTITDADGGSPWTSAAAGDWMYITEHSDNNGWWHITTATDANNQIVANGDNIDGTHAFTDGSTQTARVRTYSPEQCEILVADILDSVGTSARMRPSIDYGPRGRWFQSGLQMHALSASCYVYVTLA